METSKLLKMVTVLTLSTASLSATAQSAGGNGSGGGNSATAKVWAERDVVELIEKSRLPLTLLMNLKQMQRIDDEILNSPESPSTAALKKVFVTPDSNKVFEVIRTVGFQYRPDCAGTEMSAQINQLGSPICIAPGKIAKKLNSGATINSIYALLAHEISHQFGTSDKPRATGSLSTTWKSEAEDFQDVCNLSLDLTAFRADFAIYRRQVQLFELRRTAKKAIAVLEKRNGGNLACALMTKASGQGDTISSDSYPGLDSGIKFFVHPRSMVDPIAIALAQIYVASTTCLIEDPKTRLDLTNRFKGRASTTIADFYGVKKGQTVMNVGNATVKNPLKHGFAGAAADLKSAVAGIEEEIRRIDARYAPLTDYLGSDRARFFPSDRKEIGMP